MSEAEGEHEAATGLGWPGRLVVLALALGAIAIGATSGFGLIFAIPYAGVGGVLAIRRPGTWIGWTLLLMGWLHALAAASVDGTEAQFSAGPPLPLAVAAVATSVAGTAVFLGYTYLAIVFPSGRWPGGRWGRVSRIALGYGLLVFALTAFAPTIEVSLSSVGTQVAVKNPFAVLPDLPLWSLGISGVLFPILFLTMAAAAISLFLRLRRAEGIEHQQLRWITIATLLVVLGVVIGLVLSTVVPGGDATGLVWIPAILAFPTVPIAIGVAVLRYRLYDIDTIVNRAIVYGLLTAILAGASAALIGLFERVFEGIIGPGSDASIILTTLLVVTAFNPVKNRLQALVDRRFKEVRDPVADLAAFEAEVRGGIARPERRRVLRRLVDVAMTGLAATGGTVTLAGPGAPAWTAGAGKPIAGEPVVVTATAGGASAELRLGGVPAPRAAEALHAALVTALEETAGS